MENTKTSVFKDIVDFFNSFIGTNNVNSGKITMSDLKAKDWNNISDKDKKEILIESPKRIKVLVAKLLDRVLPNRKKKGSLSLEREQLLPNLKNGAKVVESEKSDDFAK